MISFLHDPMFSHFGGTPTCHGQTKGHMNTAYTALAQLHVIKVET